MNLADFQNDPFFIKFIQRTARMLGEYYQQKAPSMTTEELYADSEFFPMYNSERDYSDKINGYVCKDANGTMMRLVSAADIGLVTTDNLGESPSVIWKKCWSKDPMRAKPFEASDASPYGEGECCVFEGVVYRSLHDMNVMSPEDDPESWEEVTF